MTVINFETEGFTVFKETKHLRLCTTTKQDSEHLFVTVDSSESLNIEYGSFDPRVDEKLYCTVAKIKNGVVEPVGDRYTTYIIDNNLIDEFNELVEAAKRVKNNKYIKTPEEAKETIIKFIEDLDDENK